MAGLFKSIQDKGGLKEFGQHRTDQQRRNPGARFGQTGGKAGFRPGNIGGADQPFGVNPSGNVFKRNLGGTGG